MVRMDRLKHPLVQAMRPCILILAMALSLCHVGEVSAQTTSTADHVEILNADRWDFDQAVAPGAQRLIGHVRFKHADALMRCDSAYLYEDQRVEAFGHVGIVQGDTMEITGDRLAYSARERLATITGQVKLTTPEMVLSTTALTYDLIKQQGRYDQGARIISVKGNNTLTSDHGTYLVWEHLFQFSGNVRLEHPDRTITADTLHYVTTTGMARFFGPTHIVQGSTRLYCERGYYDTRAEQGTFTQAGRIISEGTEITGDSLLYDRQTGVGQGWGHVTMIDTANGILVSGAIGKHMMEEGRTIITGQAELQMLMGKDTLFLHADTLFGFQDSIAGRRLVARRNVRFFKSDLQGVCDSMSYAQQDSMMFLRGGPFLWSDKDQINGDSIRLKLKDGKADRLLIEGDAFLITQVDSIHFDQVTGTTLTGFFRDDQLASMIAEGNARTAYFARETKEGVERVTGLNRADCSRILITLDSGQVSTITFITQPDAVLYPLGMAPDEELRLNGFKWNSDARPVDRADIFRKMTDRTMAVGER